MKKTCILAIETSCDDTAIACSLNNRLLSEQIKSSIEEHEKFGGIVPEIAARSHEKNIAICFKKLFKNLNIKYKDLTHISYTSDPGLPGSLHIGKAFAKSLSSLLNIPLIPINHMDGHIFSFSIGLTQKIKFPFLSLVASGGHTCIYLIKNYKQKIILNETSDDAIGEALDKIGRCLNLSYPGGVSIDNIYDTKKATLKLIKHYHPTQSFSFSGLKTTIMNMVNTLKMKNENIDQITIASSALKWIVEEIIIKLNYYANIYKIKTIVIGGGVSANNLLRNELTSLEYQIFLPLKKFSGDNASMILNYANILLTKKSLL